MSFNKLINLRGLYSYQNMTDLWLSNNKLENFEDFKELENLPKIETIYVNGNPVVQFKSYRE